MEIDVRNKCLTMHFAIDSDVFYRLLSANRQVSRSKDHKQIQMKEFVERKREIWNKMKKINWFVRGEKDFSASVQLQYILDKKDIEPIDLALVRKTYENVEFEEVLGNDSEMNEWQSMVQFTIETGKGVSSVYFSLHKIRNSITGKNDQKYKIPKQSGIQSNSLLKNETIAHCIQ